MELGAIPKRKGGQTGKLLTEEEDVQMSDNDPIATSIESLPDEVLEHILSLLSPYSDLENCALTCSRFGQSLSAKSPHNPADFSTVLFIIPFWLLINEKNVS